MKQPKQTVRVAVIGVGNIGLAHAATIARGDVPGMTLAALCDIDPQKRAHLQAAYPDVPVFATYEALLESRICDAALCDAVIISTPHKFHPPMAKAALEAGLHALSEKPAGVDVSALSDLYATAKASDCVFGMMFNQRTDPLFAKAREIVQSGRLGAPKRLVWIITNWYRTQSYYDSGAWRATWCGEGGGVLLNQAPHNLDLWQWICGMPASLSARCDVARYHRIEVEDDATLFTRYENGATGLFITSTGEYPGTNRLEISGEKGKLVLEDGLLKWWQLDENEGAVRWESEEGMPRIPLHYTEERFGDGPQHLGIIQNFANAILHGETLISPAADGLNELTLSNAAYLSQWTGKEVALPLNNAEFDALLAEHAAHSLPHEALAKLPDGEYSERWQTRW